MKKIAVPKVELSYKTFKVDECELINQNIIDDIIREHVEEKDRYLFQALKNNALYIVSSRKPMEMSRDFSTGKYMVSGGWSYGTSAIDVSSAIECMWLGDGRARLNELTNGKWRDMTYEEVKRYLKHDRQRP